MLYRNVEGDSITCQPSYGHAPDLLEQTATPTLLFEMMASPAAKLLGRSRRCRRPAQPAEAAASATAEPA